MTHNNTLRDNLTKTIHNLWKKVSGIPPVPAEPELKPTAKEITSQRNEISCKCGWHGRGNEGLREYSVLSEQIIELKLFCKECREYLGFIIYKDAA